MRSPGQPPQRRAYPACARFVSGPPTPTALRRLAPAAGVGSRGARDHLAVHHVHGHRAQRFGRWASEHGAGRRVVLRPMAGTVQLLAGRRHAVQPRWVQMALNAAAVPAVGRATTIGAPAAFLVTTPVPTGMSASAAGTAPPADAVPDPADPAPEADPLDAPAPAP